MERHARDGEGNTDAEKCMSMQELGSVIAPIIGPESTESVSAHLAQRLSH
jgi:hypothetical protein